ncbi:condensation domain-containing protein [Pantoea sp. FN0305]|uniref:condensation domain-containing protein n=1 Tax=Pantoea sp. FN0305 TaxID=3418559 RepID=UPI003CEB40F0
MSLQSVQHNSANDERNLHQPHEGASWPLGYAQHCFWFVAATLGDTANNQNCIQIDGEIQPALLEQVINELITRHSTLRSAISRWTPTQRTLPAKGFDLPFSDLTALAPAQAQQQIAALAQHFLSTPFDLQKPPLLRVQLFRLQPRQYVLVICFPHIVADGAAVHLFCQQLWQRYRQRAEGRRVPLSEQEEIPFSAVIAQERARYQQMGTQDQAFWRNHLQGYSWATFPARYINQTEVQASERYITFPADSYERLENVARQRKVSLQMVLLALIARVVHTMTGASRFALNSVLEGRDRPGSETLMAPLLRVMPVPLDMASATTFSALLTQVREKVLSAYDHIDCPWGLPVGVMAEQRWRNSPRLLPPLIRAASSLYAALCPRAALYPHFLADFLFMEPQPPQALFRQTSRSEGIADPIINVNILQDAFRQQPTAGIEDFLQLSVWQQPEAEGDQQDAGNWENDSINIYLTRSAQGKPVLRITCCCFNLDGITQFTDLLQQEINAAAFETLR